MDKLGEIVVAILLIGISPLIIFSILDGIGLINIGSGLGLGLFMISAVALSIIISIIGTIVITVKKIIKWKQERK